MSIFGAMATAVLGMNAQSKSLGHISDNIANAQTTGYKRVDTSFQTLVLQSSATLHSPGGVQALPAYTNNIQGALSQTQNPTNIAIQGHGFFAVSPAIPAVAQSAAKQAEAGQIYFTRAGDFELNRDRFLVNSAGYALNGYAIDLETGAESNTLEPIQITDLGSSPKKTSVVNIKANLPTAPSLTTPLTPTPVQVYDAAGTVHTVNLKWRQQGAGEWRLIPEAADSTLSPVKGSFPGYAVSSVISSTTEGKTPRAQVDVHTFSGSNLKVGDIYTVSVQGKVYSLELTQGNISGVSNFNGVAAALADKINSAVPSAGVTASTAPGGKLVITAQTPGTGFTSNAEVENATTTTNTVDPLYMQQTATSTVPQICSLTFKGPSIDIGDMFLVRVPDTVMGMRDYTLTVTPANIDSLSDINGVAAALRDKINANTVNTPVVATTTGGALVLTAKQVGVAFDAPSASIGNGSLTPNTSSKATQPTNITGVRQRQTISLTGTLGDIGALYSINIKSPATSVGVVDTTGDGTQPASENEPQISFVDFPTSEEGTISVGNEYRFVVNGTTYSVLIPTDEKKSGLRDISGVLAELRDKVNNDGGAAVTAEIVDGRLKLTGKVPGEGFALEPGTAPTSFNRTVEYRTTGDELAMSDITARMATLINALGLPVTASSQGSVISMSSTTEGGQFVTETSATKGTTPAHIGLKFGGTDPITGEVSPPGTLTRIDTARVGTGTAVTPVSTEAGAPATITFTVDYGYGPQEITLNLGTFQEPKGLTQFDGDKITTSAITQDGSPRGSFKDVEIGYAGAVIVNYDNGQSREVARIPVMLFNNPDALRWHTGGVYSKTLESGEPIPKESGIEGAGTIMASNLENSNVDIADEFTKLIVTQRTYSANTKIVTTSDEMLQEVIGLKR